MIFETGINKSKTNTKTSGSVLCNDVPEYHAILNISDEGQDPHTISITDGNKPSCSVPCTLIEKKENKFNTVNKFLIVADQKHDLSYLKHEKPIWLLQDDEHYSQNLAYLSGVVLQSANSYCVHHLQQIQLHHNKTSYISNIIAHFKLQCELNIWNTNDTTQSLSHIISEHLGKTYGKQVIDYLRELPYHTDKFENIDNNFLSINLIKNMCWINESLDTLTSRIEKQFSLETLRNAIKNIPENRRPAYDYKSRRKTAKLLVTHIKCRISYLAHLLPDQLYHIITALVPEFNQYVCTSIDLLAAITQAEYGEHIISRIQTPLNEYRQKLKSDYNVISKQQRQIHKEQTVHNTKQQMVKYEGEWPQLVSESIILECLSDYRKGTVWKSPPVCAACGQIKDCGHILLEVPGMTSGPPEVLKLLKNNNAWILQHEPNALLYESQHLNGLLLDQLGIQKKTGNTKNTCDVTVTLCTHCYESLKKKKIPKFSLVNNLYRGKLCEEFKDLTWIEEMVCAIYRNTAHVTRLYGSSDPKQPTVLHGNTCAHDMNIVSTASVLPRTPTDVNGMLTVVFIGAGKFNLNTLHHLFKVRKNLIWAFLLALKARNKLYMHVKLDEKNLNLYPIDGALPGIEKNIIQDHEMNSKNTFLEETAGFSLHPAAEYAEQKNSSSSSNIISTDVMLEKMGVADPESVKLSGRSFTASALRNLVMADMKTQLPDLVIHSGANAVSEYNNPNLFPGMFPTLFPLGIGGFDDKDRSTNLSFQQQADYYLNLHDRSFRYHYSFVFVAFNIWQRRLAHLHTSFTVKNANFDLVAEKINEVSSQTLLDVADRLEKENSLGCLTVEQANAMQLLKKVNTISARIPGSQAMKIFSRNEIRSYFSYFGLPHIYFTFNPCAAHSPIFQVMFGDESVDLSAQFPKLVDIHERALRLAKDPVAATDYFQFCINALFTHLFGWNFKYNKTTERGGILGKLRAFYGTSEFTERGSLHGHFLLWLLGGLNPTDLHEKMRNSVQYQQQFFEFFESIIHHHLPNDDIQIDESYEPRCERPPNPPSPSDHMNIINEWNSVLVTQIKMCGEVLQRHKCGTVCHKYGKDDKCRFLFPHEIVEASHFDSDTNSIVMLCRDSTINYFNPYILVFCRHNHDIKCILSGKGAKAAMFYITDYITKMDMKTYQSLTLLSKAVAKVSTFSDKSPIDSAKTLLHKCVSQFTRQQQIHAQQAVRYLRGYTDTITSHETVAILSSNLMAFIRKNYPNHKDDNDDYEEEEIEPLPLQVEKNSKGELISTHQLHHYLYRDDSLAHMSFYDFSRCIRLEHQSRSQKNKNTHETRLGVLQRHKIKSPHPLSKTHVLVEHWNESRAEGHKELIPRVLGMSIPRKTSPEWIPFVLAHFKPFSITVHLLNENETWAHAYSNHQFQSHHDFIMKNWDAIHECEDERDAERIKRQSAATQTSKAMTAALYQMDDGSDNEINLTPSRRQIERDFQIHQFVLNLQQANWFKAPDIKLPNFNNQLSSHAVQASHFLYSGAKAQNILRSDLERWKNEIKNQEIIIAAKRRNIASPTCSKVPTTEWNAPLSDHQTVSRQLTETPNMHVIDYEMKGSNQEMNKNTETSTSPESILLTVQTKFKLNEKQIQAFRIIALNFLNKCVYKNAATKPVHMLMTGPGGTGKTHTVRAVKEVMEYYGCGHQIRFLAPTGPAASLIDGMTIHKGLGIKITRNDRDQNKSENNSKEDYLVTVNIQNKSALREEWRHVEIVLIDEASLLSQELLCEVDHALRYAKEKPNEWFGGIIVIFAGDFFQYPPVMGTPLYTPIANQGKANDDEFKKRFGRLAWKTVDTVIEMTEQHRMKDDKEYAEAVLHLRTRQCNLHDIELFNSRVIKSPNNTHGVDMGAPENLHAAAIVKTNALREVLNTLKAKANCSQNSIDQSPELVICGAHDVVKNLPTLEDHEYKSLLQLDFSHSKLQRSLPGFLTLYIGMPVILRIRNLSTDLKITNGAQGYIRHIDAKILPHGVTHCQCAIIEFPDSPIKLSDLPRGFFPITPLTFTFTTNIRDTKVRITRHQLPIQPAFAVTGHFAQGKGLPKILTPLHEGGFAAYVAASRAFSRNGLCITQPVRQQELNTPIPYNLYTENRRLQALEHNTQITHNFSNQTYIPVPDPEGDINIDTATIQITAVYTTSEKRKYKDITACDPSDSGKQTHHKSKKKRTTSSAMDQSTATTIMRFQFMAGCQWSQQDWSCAYDTTFMSLFSTFLSLSGRQQQQLQIQLNKSGNFGDSLRNLTNTNNPTGNDFNDARDHLRDYLSSNDPLTFIRHGHHGASVSNIFEKLFPSQQGCSGIGKKYPVSIFLLRPSWVN